MNRRQRRGGGSRLVRLDRDVRREPEEALPRRHLEAAAAEEPRRGPRRDALRRTRGEDARAMRLVEDDRRPPRARQLVGERRVRGGDAPRDDVDADPEEGSSDAASAYVPGVGITPGSSFSPLLSYSTVSPTTKCPPCCPFRFFQPPGAWRRSRSSGLV
jgi:hypothetical protein